MKRVLTGIVVGGAALAAVLRLDSPWILILCAFLMEIAAFELVRLGRQAPADGLLLCVLGAVPALSVSRLFLQPVVSLGLLVVLPILFAAILLASRREPAQSMAALGWFSFGLPYLVLPVWSLYELHRQSPGLLAVLLVSVWCNDSAAFLVGSRFGRHKMTPRLSPKKSWEGAAAGFAAGLLAAAAGLYWVDADGSLWLLWVFAAVIPAAQAGDLMESLLKRAVGVKDSGSILPGHGGMLDRLDAIILAAPVFYGLLELVRLSH